MFDLHAYMDKQIPFSEKTYGPGDRSKGVVDHIRKELIEIEENPQDLEEWIDVLILALDGAWRAGYQPLQITDMLVWKQQKNHARSWPDWRTADTDKAIEHIRD